MMAVCEKCGCRAGKGGKAVHHDNCVRNRCPYCKVDFNACQWAGQERPEVVCGLCRNHYYANRMPVAFNGV
jgi:hypothetical protein